MLTKFKPTAKFEPENHRYRIAPIPMGKFTVGAALRAIKTTTHLRWREIAKFCGLSDQTTAFRIAYVSSDRPNPIRRALSEYLVVTLSDGNQPVAYLYDSEHKPTSVPAPHVAVTLNNHTRGALEITELVPKNLTSRVTIDDPLSRRLTMTIKPTNGYLLDSTDQALGIPETEIVASGTAKTLNARLRSINFVGTEPGDAKIDIVVDDHYGDTASIVSTSLNVHVLVGQAVSIPELTVPADGEVYAGEDTVIPAATVADADGKLLEIRVTPFNCQVFGFAYNLDVIGANGVRVMAARPEIINQDLAALKVRVPADVTKKEAIIGYELRSGTTIIRKYTRLNIVERAAEEEEPENPNAIVIDDLSNGFSDPEADIVVSAAFPAGKTSLKANTIKVTSSAESSSAVLNATDKVTLDGVETTGNLAKNVSNAAWSINNKGDVVIKNCDFSQTGYNCVEIGLATTAAPKSVLIENCNFGDVSNNSILVFNTVANAVITIKDCSFGKVSDVLRISNRDNVSGVVVNLINCMVESTDNDKSWPLVLCEDYTAKTADEATTANRYAPDKLTINIENCTIAGQKAVMPADPAAVFGQNVDGNLVTVYADKGGIVAYDAARYPTINIR
jgi:hypothetical protein